RSFKVIVTWNSTDYVLEADLPAAHATAFVYVGTQDTDTGQNGGSFGIIQGHHIDLRLAQTSSNGEALDYEWWIDTASGSAQPGVDYDDSVTSGIFHLPHGNADILIPTFDTDDESTKSVVFHFRPVADTNPADEVVIEADIFGNDILNFSA